MEDAPKKLLVIAVDVDSGTIREPESAGSSGTFIPDPNPRVVGIVDSNIFDAFVQDLLNTQKAERVRRAGHPKEPHQGANPPSYSGTVLHTQNSPGCTWVVINGWPFCY